MSLRKATRLDSIRFRLDPIRETIYKNLKNTVGFHTGIMSIMRLWSSILDKVKWSSEPYGLAKREDFGEFTELIAHMFAYDNKHYYVYRAISDSSKIGYLSRKQYYKMKLYIELDRRRGAYESDIEDFVLDYCKETGTMASPFKLFKGALIENPKMKFLRKFFKVTNEHERTIENASFAELFIKSLINGCSPLDLVETDDIQQCYDVSLPDGYEFSDKRYCTHSCMERSPVGDFYKSFPVKGVLVKNGQDTVGRFLLWTLPDGKEYVDRLYVRAAHAKTALISIDKKYPQAIKYPYLTDKSENPMGDSPIPFYPIPIKDIHSFINCRSFAWVDTFAHIYRNKETDSYVISNTRNPSQETRAEFAKYKYVYTMRGGTPHDRRICMDCGKVILGNVDVENEGFMHQLLHCKGYKASGKKEPVYVALIKDYLDQIGGKGNDGKNSTEENFFSLLDL